MTLKSEEQYLVARPSLGDVREVDEVRQFLAGEGLHVDLYDGHTAIITPREISRPSSLKYFPLVDIDGTTHRSTANLTQIVRRFVPSASSQEVYDSLRIAMTWDDARGLFDPYFAIELLRRKTDGMDDMQALRNAQETAREARRLGFLPELTIPAEGDPSWIPDIYTHTPLLLEAIHEVSGMSAWAMTRGTYMAQAEKVAGLMKDGLLGGAVVTKLSKRPVVQSLFQENALPINAAVRAAGYVWGQTDVSMTSESLRDITEVLSGVQAAHAYGRGILIDHTDEWFTCNEAERDALPDTIAHIPSEPESLSYAQFVDAVSAALP